MQLQKNQSVTVVRNQFCAVLTETGISDSYRVRFGCTSSQNVCDDQMLQIILSLGTFGTSKLASKQVFLLSEVHERSLFQFFMPVLEFWDVIGYDDALGPQLGLCVCSRNAFVECSLRKFLYKFLNELLKKSSPKAPYERIL